MNSGIRNKIKKYGITARIVILFTILVIVPFLIGAVLLVFVFRNYTVDNMGVSTADAVTTVGNQIQMAVKRYEEDSMFLYYNGYVEYFDKNRETTKYEKKMIEDALVSASFRYNDSCCICSYRERDISWRSRLLSSEENYGAISKGNYRSGRGMFMVSHQ